MVQLSMMDDQQYAVLACRCVRQNILEMDKNFPPFVSEFMAI